MSGVSSHRKPPRVGDAPLVRRSLIAFVLIIGTLLVVAPLVIIGVEAFSQGWKAYSATITHPDTRHAIMLTVLTALIAVPVNTAFGVAAAWSITKFDFPGRRFLLVLIEIPFSISPIVAGVAYLFVYGLQGLFGPFLDAHDIKILFALPGIVIASMFVTAPFVARELIPLMQAQGRDLEEAATSLGASGWRTFFSVTLPNIKWALLYGVVLCNARVMGNLAPYRSCQAIFAVRPIRCRCISSCFITITRRLALSPRRRSSRPSPSSPSSPRWRWNGAAQGAGVKRPTPMPPSPRRPDSHENPPRKCGEDL